MRYAVLLLISSLSLFAENWPGWRGPSGDGISLEKGIPVKWSATENIAWKVAVPGNGHASLTSPKTSPPPSTTLSISAPASPSQPTG